MTGLKPSQGTDPTAHKFTPLDGDPTCCRCGEGPDHEDHVESQAVIKRSTGFSKLLVRVFNAAYKICRLEDRAMAVRVGDRLVLGETWLELWNALQSVEQLGHPLSLTALALPEEQVWKLQNLVDACRSFFADELTRPEPGVGNRVVDALKLLENFAVSSVMDFTVDQAPLFQTLLDEVREQERTTYVSPGLTRAIKALEGVAIKQVRVYSRTEAYAFIAAAVMAKGKQAPDADAALLAALTSTPKPEDAERAGALDALIAANTRIRAERDALKAKVAEVEAQRDAAQGDVHKHMAELVADVEKIPGVIALRARAEKAEADLKEAVVARATALDIAGIAGKMLDTDTGAIKAAEVRLEVMAQALKEETAKRQTAEDNLRILESSNAISGMVRKSTSVLREEIKGLRAESQALRQTIATLTTDGEMAKSEVMRINALLAVQRRWSGMPLSGVRFTADEMDFALKDWKHRAHTVEQQLNELHKKHVELMTETSKLLQCIDGGCFSDRSRPSEEKAATQVHAVKQLLGLTGLEASAAGPTNTEERSHFACNSETGAGLAGCRRKGKEHRTHLCHSTVQAHVIHRCDCGVTWSWAQDNRMRDDVNKILAEYGAPPMKTFDGPRALPAVSPALTLADFEAAPVWSMAVETMLDGTESVFLRNEGGWLKGTVTVKSEVLAKSAAKFRTRILPPESAEGPKPVLIQCVSHKRYGCRMCERPEPKNTTCTERCSECQDECAAVQVHEGKHYCEQHKGMRPDRCELIDEEGRRCTQPYGHRTAHQYPVPPRTLRAGDTIASAAEAASLEVGTGARRPGDGHAYYRGKPPESWTHAVMGAVDHAEVIGAVIEHVGWRPLPSDPPITAVCGVCNTEFQTAFTPVQRIVKCPIGHMTSVGPAPDAPSATPTDAAVKPTRNLDAAKAALERARKTQPIDVGELHAAVGYLLFAQRDGETGPGK